jgi:hypothetical protein
VGDNADMRGKLLPASLDELCVLISQNTEHMPFQQFSDEKGLPGVLKYVLSHFHNNFSEHAVSFPTYR